MYKNIQDNHILNIVVIKNKMITKKDLYHKISKLTNIIMIKVQN